MTTYQDPPLQSRRAVRQGERAEAQPSSPFTPPQVPRTAAGAGEPLSYVTQNRPPLPAYDQAPPRGRRAAEAEAPHEPEAEAEVQQEDAQPQPPSGFRPRDYSPEARTAPPAWSPEHERESGMVEYHTQARAEVVPPVPAPAAPPAAAASLAASLASEPSEQTFTRRELRALREANGVVPADTSVTSVIPPAPQPEASAPVAAPFPFAGPAAGEEQHETRRGRRAADPHPEAPAVVEAALEQQAPEAPVEPVSAAPLLIEPAPAFAAPAPAVPLDLPAAPAAPLDAPAAPEQRAVVLPPEPAAYAPQEVASPAEAAPAPSPVAASAVPPAVAAEPPTAVPTTTGERPVGHWTTQSDLDERTQVNESTISRRVGSGALTTNALVLPSLPGHDMSTGETMLTGTVSLPAVLAETGAHSAIDESDIDHLLDPGDHQLVHTDSVPISAFKAVSSHSGNRQQLIANGKPHRGNRALTALIVSASGMVVVVVTLLVVALVTDVI